MSFLSLKIKEAINVVVREEVEAGRIRDGDQVVIDYRGTVHIDRRPSDVSDQVAAVALGQLWHILGAENQTEAVSRARSLVRRYQ